MPFVRTIFRIRAPSVSDLYTHQEDSVAFQIDRGMGFSSAQTHCEALHYLHFWFQLNVIDKFTNFCCKIFERVFSDTHIANRVA